MEKAALEGTPSREDVPTGSNSTEQENEPVRICFNMIHYCLATQLTIAKNIQKKLCTGSIFLLRIAYSCEHISC